MSLMPIRLSTVWLNNFPKCEPSFEVLVAPRSLGLPAQSQTVGVEGP
jgi:hypothetical protein